MDVDMGSSDSMEVVRSCTILNTHLEGSFQLKWSFVLCTCFQFSMSVLNISLSHLIWTPLKLVPPRTNFSGPSLKNLFLL